MDEWDKTPPVSIQMHSSHSALWPVQVFNLANMQIKCYLVKLNILYRLGIEHKRLDAFSNIVPVVLLATHGATVTSAHL